jgi:hypothetical protein
VLSPLEVLLLVSHTFERLGIDYVVVGSFASSARGQARATADVDVIADIRPEHVPLLAAAFAEAFYIDEDARIHRRLWSRSAATGRRADARRILDELKDLSKTKYVDAYYVAPIYVALGDRDQAFAWLQMAYRDRSAWLPWLMIEPKFDDLCSDPRYAELTRQIGFKT